MSGRVVRQRHAVVAGALLVALGWSGGCASRLIVDKATATRVIPAPAPIERSDGLEQIPEDTWWGKYVGAPPSAFRNEANAAFADARSAYWDGDIPKAVERLRLAHARGGLREERFHELLLQCYERADRWEDSLPLYAELRIEEKHQQWLDYAKKRAAWPRMTVEFAAGAASLPCTLLRGEWVVVEVRVDGTNARVLLDTGAETGWWTTEFAARVGLERLGEPMTVSDVHGADAKGELAVVRELRLGGMTARNVVGAVGESAAFVRKVGVDGIVGWPREAKPFAFWLGGYRFETPVAHLEKREDLHDGWSYLDGMIGNASFLSGRLTLCGIRRLVAFTPTVGTTERVMPETRQEPTAR